MTVNGVCGARSVGTARTAGYHSASGRFTSLRSATGEQAERALETRILLSNSEAQEKVQEPELPNTRLHALSLPLVLPDSLRSPG